MEYRVKIELFEGPLDLLLYLIKKNELDIYDIPIATITEQYLEYLKLLKELNLEVASEYLVMAATLAQIKSRMLVPVSDEETDEEDPRAELIQQLLEYQKYKEAADDLISRELLGRDTFTPVQDDEAETQDEQGETVIEASLFELLDAFQSVLKNASERNAGKEIFLLEEVSQHRISLSERMDEILLQLNQGPETHPDQIGIPFEDLFAGQINRELIIVTFLALLELMRLKLVRMVQLELFGAIWVRPRISPVPGNQDGPLSENQQLG